VADRAAVLRRGELVAVRPAQHWRVSPDELVDLYLK
jgi:hypothetical protein